MALISIFLRPMLALDAHVTFEPVDATDVGGVVLSRANFGLRVAGGGEKGDKDDASSACERDCRGESAGDARVFVSIEARARPAVTVVHLSCLQQKANELPEWFEGR
jgi:hypothetical protein